MTVNSVFGGQFSVLMFVHREANELKYAVILQFHLGYVYTRGNFSGIINAPGFIEFVVFGFVGIYIKRVFVTHVGNLGTLILE